jgi:hypothetical protein
MIVEAASKKAAPVRSQRPRHYVHRPLFTILRPLLRYSTTRDAYVFRIVGGRFGPVVRIDRRGRQQPFPGPDRRRGGQPRRGLPA